MASRVPWRDAIAMALRTLRANRLRRALTMLGIVIGNASVITLVGVGRGGQDLAAAQLNVLGVHVLFVAPGSHNTRHQGVQPPRTLVLDDAAAIAEQVPSVVAVAPQIASSEVLQVGSRSKSVAVQGVTPEFLQVRRLEVAQGRFFSGAEQQAARNLVVIGPDLRTQLFAGRAAVGERLRIRDQSFVVIGVMAPKGAVFGQNIDENAYIPITTMASKLSGREASTGIALSFISLEARDERSVNAAVFQVTNLLRRRHHILREDDFEVRSQKEAMAIVGSITGGLTWMLGAIGAISLLVGGIGIMNIMLVAVSERTAEICLGCSAAWRPASATSDSLPWVLDGVLAASFSAESVHRPPRPSSTPSMRMGMCRAAAASIRSASGPSWADPQVLNHVLVMGPWTLLLSTALGVTPPSPWSADLLPLLKTLSRYGFRVRLQPPPRSGAYGLFDPKFRTLWIAPITHDLGIARPTLLHEAAHAAQSCPAGVVRPIGWSLPLTPLIEGEISRITHTHYGRQHLAIEQEAFAVQGQPNAVVLIMRALRQRCR